MVYIFVIFLIALIIAHFRQVFRINVKRADILCISLIIKFHRPVGMAHANYKAPLQMARKKAEFV